MTVPLFLRPYTSSSISDLSIGALSDVSDFSDISDSSDIGESHPLDSISETLKLKYRKIKALKRAKESSTK